VVFNQGVASAGYRDPERRGFAPHHRGIVRRLVYEAAARTSATGVLSPHF